MLKAMHSKKGFTLIELLIVVAIIAILAAIAIPQFAAYRIRGFNASANSDARNLATTQEALFADTQAYGQAAVAILPSTTPACGAGPVAVTGPQNPASTVSGAYLFNGQGTAGFSISNNVVIAVSGTVPASGTACSAYAIVAKHTSGNACYGRDSDSTSSYRAVAVAGTALTSAGAPTSTQSADNLLGANTTGCTGFVAQ